MYALAAVGVTSVAVVAGVQHSPSEASTTAAAVTAPAVVAPTPSAAVLADRAVPVSRSAARTTAARPGVRARKQRARLREQRAEQRRQHRREQRRSQVPAAPSDAAETVASALDSSVNVPGQCLAWSREQAGIPSRYSDAATAWEHATGRHRADRNPPRGAAVYWTGGSRGHGHIAISLGDGRVRSSDADGYGEVGTIRINKLSSEWDLHYAGWANSINGYRIPGVRAA